MTAKIVYYGPGLCGKTTNLNTIYGKTSKQARGEMVSLNTETDRTLFFDLLPMDVGTVGGFKTKLQLYTVPGQVFYNSTRKLVLKGVDGIVFVVDSQTAMSDACKDSFLNLQENLKELGLELKDIPIVFQWNKRDLKNVVPVEELEAHFNSMNLPSFQSVASDGAGVFETLRGITRLVLGHIKTHVLGEGAAPAAKPAPVAAAASGAEALNLSDLPAVSDLLELNTSVVEAAMEAAPDELTDTGLNIEAPELPEHPSALGSEPLPDTEDADSLLGEAPVFDEPAQATPEFDESLVEAPAFDAPAAPELEPEPVQVQAPPAVEPPHPPVPTMIIPKATAKPKIPTMDKGAIDSLMGELTQVGRLGAPSVLRLDVPDIEGDVEVVVQVMKAGQVIAEQRQVRPAPRKGITSKLSVELKRS